MEIPDLVEDLPEGIEFQVNNIDYNVRVPIKVGGTAESKNDRVPITIITGYLGSGKSTLLQKIGKTSKKRLAIILNEFGDTSDIEKSITIQDDRNNVQEWLDLGNGCLCCTVKDNGVTAIEQLIANSKDKIDYILLETTGVADPAPIAKMFWLDEGLSSNVYIDGVITVLDTQNIITCLEDIGGHWHNENNHLKTGKDVSKEEVENEKLQLEQGLTTAHLQISLADTILLNKIDLVEQDHIKTVTEKVKSINSSCPIYTTSFGDIDLNKILDLHAFEANIDKINSSTNSSFHDHRIATVTITTPFFTNPNQFALVEKFIQRVLWDNDDIEVHRLKGILVCIKGEPDVRVVQGVRDTYDIVSGGVLLDNIKENKLVFIGKNLDGDSLSQELKRYLAEA